MSGLLVNGLESGEALWKWRLQRAPKEARSAAQMLSPVTAVPFDSVVLASLDLEQVASLVSLETGRWQAWRDLKVDGVEALWRRVDDVIQIVLSGQVSEADAQVWTEVSRLAKPKSRAVHIWGTANPHLMKPILQHLGRESCFHQAPGCFLS